MKRRLFFFAVLLGALLLLVFIFRHGRGASSVSLPSSDKSLQNIVDLAGHSAKLPRDIRRIVLIRGRDIYELAALLGDDLPNRIVALGPDLRTADRDGYDAFVARFPSLASLPETGDIFKDAVSAEQIIALNPDLVVMDVFMIERGYKCVARLQQAGLPLLFLDASSDPFFSPQRSLRLLGSVLGDRAKQRAEEIASIADERTHLVLSRIDKITGPKPSVYLETEGHLTNPGVTYGGYGNPRHYSSWGETLHRLGVKNIADGIVANMGQLHPEFILQADPEIIVITGQSWSKPGVLHLGYGAQVEPGLRVLSELRNRSGWSSLRAVKNRRIYGVYHNFSMHFFGFIATEQLAKDFYPDVFQDLHPEKEFEEFHNRFLPIPFRGVWTLPCEKLNDN